MKRNSILKIVLNLVLVAVLPSMQVTPVAAQNAPSAAIVLPTDRTVLPIPEPQIPHSTVFDVRNATPHLSSKKRRFVIDKTGNFGRE